SLFLFLNTLLSEVFSLSLLDALPISHGFAAPLRVALGLRPKCPQGTRFPSRLSGARNACAVCVRRKDGPCHSERRVGMGPARKRSEEHTSELQSRFELVCRLLLEKKK